MCRIVNSQLWWEEDWLTRAALGGREYWSHGIGEPERTKALRCVKAQMKAGSTP